MTERSNLRWKQSWTMTLEVEKIKKGFQVVYPRLDEPRSRVELIGRQVS